MEVMLPLRFMAAVHTLVLRGDAPALEPFYPSVGGGAVRGDEWPAFAATDLVGLDRRTRQLTYLGEVVAERRCKRGPLISSDSSTTD